MSGGLSFVLADAARVRQFALLGAGRNFLNHHATWTDAGGVPWAGARHGDLGFAVTWLGPGWVFDPYAREQLAGGLAGLRAVLAAADAIRQGESMKAALARVRCGGHAERLLWAVHRAVLGARRSTVLLPDFWLGAAVWGDDRAAWPRHWRQDVLTILKGLTWLHLTDWPENGEPSAGDATALLTNVCDLPGVTQCDESCPALGSPFHRHILVNIGRGFLGVLEQFARGEERGVREYNFIAAGRGMTLRKAGRGGRLVSVYLPAKLGSPVECAALSARQHGLLQALVRETTRPLGPPGSSADAARADCAEGNLVPVVSGRGTVACPLLAPDGRWVGFNGNKVRRGMGYRLTTPGGWLAKAGYMPSELRAFLDDLAVLADRLGLVAVGLSGKEPQWLDLSAMRQWSLTSAGRGLLRGVHLRVYTACDYVSRWNGLFGWGEEDGIDRMHCENMVRLGLVMARDRISSRDLAQALKKDPSFVNKMLGHKKPWPKGLLEEAIKWVEGRRVSVEARDVEASAPSGAEVSRGDPAGGSTPSG